MIKINGRNAVSPPTPCPGCAAAYKISTVIP